MNNNSHIDEIRSIFKTAISKGLLSIALRAKMLELNLKKSETKNKKISISEISEEEIDNLIQELEESIK